SRARSRATWQSHGSIAAHRGPPRRVAPPDQGGGGQISSTWTVCSTKSVPPGPLTVRRTVWSPPRGYALAGLCALEATPSRQCPVDESSQDDVFVNEIVIADVCGRDKAVRGDA